MKNLIKILAFLHLLFFIGQINAQESNYVRTPGYWTLGLNGGMAYQSSDVKSTLDGWGAGATLAKNLYYRPGSVFTFDLRGRLLYDQSYGLDHRPSYGILNNPAVQNYLSDNGGDDYVYLNNKTHHGELGLEGVLSFNRLREKTNVNLSLFGGIGLNYYAALTDQKNGAGQIYDYSIIDPEGRRQSNKAELTNLLNGSYETKAEGFGDAGQLAFMPDVGIELGYQLTPRFSIGLGHKLTFTRTDLFDGNQWNENNRVTGNNDLHHYTNLHLRWIINPAEERSRPPVIELMTPMSSPHQTRDPLAIIKARVKYVNSAMDINYVVNGRQAGFDFRNEILDDNFYLRPGRNTVEITATNNDGTDNETITIFYEEGGVVVPPTTNTREPRVDFTNPSRTTEYVTSNRYRVTATVSNVDRARDIDFSVNGRRISNFDFDARNDRFAADIVLNAGENRLLINVTNESRINDRDEATIVFEQNQTVDASPIVNITRPNNDPQLTDNSSYRVEADIYNVKDKIDISFTVNGNRVRNYSFNNNRVTGTVNLRNGNNNIKITGKNARGQDSDEVTIRYEKTADPIDLPIVKITSVSQPTIDPFNPNVCKVSVKASVKNVDSRNDIQFYFDGQLSSDFSYSNETFTTVLTLNPGNHSVRIKATNEAGSDEDSEDITSCTITPTGEGPEVDITAPTRTTTDQPTTTVKATVNRVERKSDITLTLNGRTINRFDYDSRRKMISAKINLNEGNNNITVSATNSYGSDSDDINVRYNKVVVTQKTPPVVSISNPRNNSATSNNSVELKATVKHVFDKEDISVFLNGRAVRSFDFSSRGGIVTATISGLNNGTNNITVKASNNDGQDEASVNVKYEVAITPPKVSISSPRNGTQTEQSSTQLKASISGVDSQRDITLKVNGTTISNFSFSRNVLTATVSLRVGANDIFVEGRNKAGKANDEVRVILKEKALPPKVSITSPNNNTTIDKNTAVIKATLANVKDNKNITLKVNGKTVKRFSYSKNQLTATVTLQSGSNTIFVEGRNTSGKDSDQIKVTYKKTVALPQVNITSPRTGMQTSESSVLLKATLKNVTSNKDITIKVNGRTISKFSYRKGSLSATLKLNAGKNTISVEGRNSAGRDSDEIAVTYEQAAPPEINSFALSQPTIDPFNPNSAKSSATAILTNITSKKQIKLYINGKLIRDFDFNTSSKKLTKVFSLVQGNNTVKLVVENTDGRKEATKSIQF